MKGVKPTAMGSILSQSGSTLGLSNVFIFSDVLNVATYELGICGHERRNGMRREPRPMSDRVDKNCEEIPLPFLHSVCSGCATLVSSTLLH
jgi:hypothetical protein